MRPGDEHLSPEELGWLLAARSEGTAQSPLLQELRQHLEQCLQCRRWAQEYDLTDAALASLRSAGRGSRGPDCPPEAEWPRLAARLLLDREAERLLKHAVRCDYCGPLLRRSAEEFSGDLSPEEEAIIGSLETAQPSWQSSMAQKLSDLAGRNLHPAQSALGLRPRAVWRWAGLAGLAALVVAAAWWLRPSPERSAERLLAEAYSAQRTLEMRIPGAAYAPLGGERGAADRSTLERPMALVKAEAIIAENLATQKGDPQWLAAKARADLLGWHYEAAMDSLKRALETQPGAPALLMDLATAHFQRAEAEDRPVDYGAALELLGQVLHREPHNAVARFNRALVYERMQMFGEARADWERCLQLEPGGQWQTEAQRHLDGVKKKSIERKSPPTR